MTRSILVVDDDPLARAVAMSILSAAGYAPFEADDGAVATDLLARRQADLMLVDMVMPEKDGVETILEVRRRWPATRILAMSSGGRRLNATDLLALARGLGADAVCHKPLRPTALLAQVAALVGEGDAALAAEAGWNAEPAAAGQAIH